MAVIIKRAAAVLALIVVAFTVLVVFGLYKALDAAPSATLASSAVGTATEQAGSLGNKPSSLLAQNIEGTKAYQVGSDAEEALSQSEEGALLGTLGQSQNAGDSGSSGGTGGTSPSASNAETTTPPASNTPTPAVPSTPSNPPAPQTPQRTYHPAVDVWVESGHWETITYPATYGERPIYGSLCNECGANVSGIASAHLKETHHSGYHEGVVGQESYEITPERSEQVWVDTSHWETQPAYWD